MKRAEGAFKAHEGLRLFYQKWETSNPKGTLIITHGQAEHSECYNRLAQGLEDLGWEIIAWDLRGHGRSDGKRGFAESFNHYCDDFVHFLKQVRIHESIEGRPMVLLGHSMGGLIQLKSLLNSPELQPTAQVLSAPLLGLVQEASKLKETLGTWLTRFVPELTLWNQIRYSQLTKDAEIISEYGKDPLRHDRISTQVYLGMLSSMNYVHRCAEKIQIPTLLQVAGADEIVSADRALEFFERLGSQSKTCIVYKNAKHEIYNDLDREVAYRDLKEFLKGFEI